MEPSKIVQEKIEERLAQLDWTHEDLAKRLGVKRATVTQTLSRGGLRVDNLLRWASALDVSPSWILGETSEEPKPEADLERFKAEALVALLRATPAQWRALRPALTAAFPDLGSLEGSNKKQPRG